MYKSKRYERITEIRNQDDISVEIKMEEKINIKEKSFYKLYYENIHRGRYSTNTYKDYYLLILIAGHIDEKNIVKIDAGLKQELKMELGDVSQNAIYTSLKNLLASGYIYKVLSRETFKPMKGYYFVSPEVATKSNTAVAQALRTYLEYNRKCLKDKTTVIYPVIVQNSIHIDGKSIPEELRSKHLETLRKKYEQ